MKEGLLTRRDQLRNWWRSVRMPRAKQRHIDQPITQREGKYLRFVLMGARAHMPKYTVYSRRGDFIMGEVEWSPQWGAYSFVPLSEKDSIVRWNAGSIAEMYAFLKELGEATGRFL